MRSNQPDDARFPADPNHGEANEKAEACRAKRAPNVGLLVVELATMPAGAILDVTRMAAALTVARRTVARMVGRRELPPPVPFGGRSVWVVDQVLAHIRAAADRAAREAEKEAARRRAMNA